MTATPFVDVEVPTPDGRTITYRIRRQSTPEAPQSAPDARNPAVSTTDTPNNAQRRTA